MNTKKQKMSIEDLRTKKGKELKVKELKKVVGGSTQRGAFVVSGRGTTFMEP